MDQSLITVRAREHLQACVAVGGVLLGVGILVILAGSGLGILVAAVGQALLLVGLVGYGVKLGTEAAARPTGEPQREGDATRSSSPTSS